MTINSTTIRVSLACDGATKIFPVNLQAYQATDLEALLTSPTGVATELVLGGDYSLAPSSSDTPPKWTLTTLAALAYPAGWTLQVFLDPVQTQASVYQPNQAFPSGALQENIDRLTQMVLRLQDQLNRAMVAPDGDVNPLLLLPGAAARANMLAGWDGAGNVTGVLAPATAFTQANFNSFLSLAAFTQAEYNALQAFAPAPLYTIQYFFKQAATLRNTTTVLANDPDLITGVLQPGFYRITTVLKFSNATTNNQGFKYKLNYTGQVTGAEPNEVFGYLVANTVFISDFAAALGGGVNGNTAAIATVGANDGLHTVNLCQMTGAGVLSFQWAQNVSSANATIVGAGSSMVVEKIG